MLNKTKYTKISGVRQKTHKSVDKIMDKAESMSKRSKEAMTHLKEKAIMMKGNADGYIQKNPEKSVLIAAGIGAVVGAVLAATMMRRKQ